MGFLVPSLDYTAKGGRNLVGKVCPMILGDLRGV